MPANSILLLFVLQSTLEVKLTEKLLYWFSDDNSYLSYLFYNINFLLLK